MTEYDYQTWLDQLFDHPDDEPEWYFSDSYEYTATAPKTLTAHALRLFEAPALLLFRYIDQQITSGLKYLIDTGCGGDLRLTSHPAIPQSDRLELAARIDRVYTQIFGARCTPALGHLSEVPEQPLNMHCYMWWDSIVLEATGNQRLDREFFEALSRPWDGRWQYRTLPATRARCTASVTGAHMHPCTRARGGHHRRISHRKPRSATRAGRLRPRRPDGVHPVITNAAGVSPAPR